MSQNETDTLNPVGKSLLDAGLKQLDEARALADELKRTADPARPMDSLERYNRMSMRLQDTAARAQLLQEVHPDGDVQKASEIIEQKANELATQLGLDRELFEVFDKLDATGLDELARRLVDKTLADFRRSGVDRDDETRKKIAALKEELTLIGQHFGRNIREDTRRITVGDATRLAGLPEDFLTTHPKDENGAITLCTDMPDYMPVMTYADDDGLREELYLQKMQIGFPKNADVLKTLLAKRHELATTLGYATYADYATELQMIRKPNAARAFIDKVAALGRPRAFADRAALLERLKQAAPEADTLMPWQGMYLTRLVKGERYAYNPKEVRPYFEVGKVLQGILDISSELFGIEFAPLDAAERWHEDVQVFAVNDASGMIGKIYLDLHPRENKYKHAAMFPMVDGVAGVRVPEGAIVCNFPDPKKGPAYLEHNDVTTFFHEFGHLLHHILGGMQRWLRFSGVATEWDFVEVPSQLFEEWAWDHDMLARFATNDDGDVIPAKLVQKMRAADEFGIGAFVLQQMAYASISLGLYDQTPDAVDVDSFVEAQFDSYSIYPRVKDTHFECGFGHLIEYASNYYTYMWSLVIAKDLYQTFKKAGLSDTSVSLAYRNAIIGRGGAKDAEDLVRDFLGRAFSFDAFEQWLSPGKA